MASFAPTTVLKNNHGSLVGGTTGFALGGPLGALLGSVLGYAYDRTRKALFAVESIYQELDDTPKPVEVSSRAQEAAFTIGVIALGAKLARLNKRLDRDTIESFRQAFKLPPSDIPMIKRMFEQALFDAVGHKPYADQLANIFAGCPEMLEALLLGLVRFAHSDDDGLTPAVLDYLDSLAAQFRVPKSRMEAILTGEGLKRPDVKPLKLKETPFDILGVSRNAPEVVIKQAYRDLLKQSHPDTLHYTSISAEMLAAANDRVAAINAAYSEIKRVKGW